jgi:predicted transcriptional regulator
VGAKQSAEMKKALRLLAKAKATGENLSQAEAARLAGVSRSAVTKQLNKTKPETKKNEDAE